MESGEEAAVLKEPTNPADESEELVELPPGLGDHQIGEAAEVFAGLPDRLSVEEYNYDHFRRGHLIADIRRTMERRGVAPGQYTWDFTLPQASGGWLRLDNLRGTPVLLHFGSYTCPASIGTVEPLKKLYARWGARVAFVDVLVRQAHPGPGAPAYQSDDQKLEDARRYQQEEGIPWPVLADDLAGTVHQVYGMLPDATYLIDVDGRIAFYNMWTHAPTLTAALEQLFRQDCRGVVGDGYDRVIHLWPALTVGWRGIERGLPDSYRDLQRAVPGSGSLLRLGYRMRPLLAPMTLRTTTTPMPVRAGLIAGVAVASLLAVGRSRMQSGAKDDRRDDS